MSVTASEVKELGPELASLSDSLVNIYLDIAGELVDEKVFGTKYSNALKLFTAHLVTMSQRQGVGGNVTSQTVGSLSQSYGGPQGDELLNLTSYGQMYLLIRKTLTQSPLCV